MSASDIFGLTDSYLMVVGADTLPDPYRSGLTSMREPKVNICMTHMDSDGHISRCTNPISLHVNVNKLAAATARALTVPQARQWCALSGLMNPSLWQYLNSGRKTGV